MPTIDEMPSATAKRMADDARAAFGGVRIGLRASASGALARPATGIVSRNPRYSRWRGPRFGAPAVSQVVQRAASGATSARPSASPRRESARGRARRARFESRDLVRGHNAAFESTITQASKTRDVTRTFRVGSQPITAARLISPRGGAAGLLGLGSLTFPGGNPFWASNYLYERFPIAAKGAGLTNRTGAAATRPADRTGTARPNRTGARATRPAPAADAIAATSANRAGLPRASQRPTTAIAVEIARAQLPTPAPQARPQASPAPARRLAPAVSVRTNPWAMLQSALAPSQAIARLMAPARALARVILPRQGARLVNALPTTMTRLGAPPTTSLGLTPLNSPMLGLQPTPQEELDPCERKRKKESKQRCSNPVVRRERRGNLIITTRRITCPQSSSKAQLALLR